MKTILSIGSVALDTIETPHGSVKDQPGGSATHFSISASFFTKVNIVGIVGEDFPEEVLNLLKSREVDVDGIDIIKGGETFRWSGYYDNNMAIAHTLDTQLNVFENFNPKIPDKFKDSKLMFIGNIDPVLQLNIIKSAGPKELICSDTMNYWISLKNQELLEVVKASDIMILNDQEARELTNKNNILKAARAVMELGPLAVVIKRGENGATIFFKDGNYFSSSAYLFEDVVDPTGAGDSFAGGFLGYLSTVSEINNKNLKKAVIYGNIMGSFNVEGFGYSRIAKLTKEDIENRYEEMKNISLY